jgi:hypothetical protein
MKRIIVLPALLLGHPNVVNFTDFGFATVRAGLVQ